MKDENFNANSLIVIVSTESQNTLGKKKLTRGAFYLKVIFLLCFQWIIMFIEVLKDVSCIGYAEVSKNGRFMCDFKFVIMLGGSLVSKYMFHT